MSLMTEHQMQKAYFEWLKIKNKNVYEMTFAIPNGGQRDIRVARKLKAEGVKAGVPDIFIAIPQKHYHGLFIEAKTEKGSAPTESQLDWLDRLDKKGYKAAVCFGLDEMIKETEDYFYEVEVLYV